tara:strand:- start:1372 stop:1608 length:237 start_codon:yes stop_codon:yes gene_type:complete
MFLLMKNMEAGKSYSREYGMFCVRLAVGLVCAFVLAVFAAPPAAVASFGSVMIAVLAILFGVAGTVFIANRVVNGSTK